MRYRIYKRIRQLKEVIRVLMLQVLEEQRARKECLTQSEDRTRILPVTDADVENKIKEVLDKTGPVR